ncbi:MAG: ethanolamine utilization protein EutH [Paludibacteraceae bacterium]|nr:ethanolamine utilization protein EutH [Paludibacteraceae bacterium]
MELFGQIVIYIIMACAVVGCIASIVKEDSELGNQFLEGINSIGSIFLPVAGIMASAPYLTWFVSKVFGPTFGLLGADQAMAATTFIAVDMGGYQLAQALAQTKESWIMAMITGYMAGATIVFSIPVALKMLQKSDRRYLAMGAMVGFVTIPIGVFISSVIIALSHPMIRETIATNGEATYQLALSLGTILHNLLPLVIICGLIAVGLYFIPEKMISAFNIFGKCMDTVLRIVFVLCVVEYFTAVFSTVLGHWGFEPIIADESDINRALEISGYIGIMLCGAFPMVWLIKRYLAKPLDWLSRYVGLSADASAGILAGTANVLALFGMVKDLQPEDKVKCIAYSVCSAFLIGDHLAFAANFQPTLIFPIMAGKFIAGCAAVYIATLFMKRGVLKIDGKNNG